MVVEVDSVEVVMLTMLEVTPARDPYDNSLQRVVPSPILYKRVSVSKPISPSANAGLAEYHSDARPRRS